MGLDIYLYRSADHEANEAHNAASNAFWDKFHGVADDDPEKVEAKAAIPPYKSHEDSPSLLYPEHYSNRRYLRSSYNESGFNRRVPQFLDDANTTLYDIFRPVADFNEVYDVKLGEWSVPGLTQAKEKALEIAGRLRESDGLQATQVTSMVGSQTHLWPPNKRIEAEDVLSWYREEREKNSQRAASPFDGSGYSTAKGAVFGFEEGKAMEVFGAVASINGMFGAEAYLVVKSDLEYYVQQAEIVGEFCDEAVALIEQDGSAYISWSG